MKQITIEGFSYDSTPENRPAICVFGEENVGKSRFACTVPHDDGLVGWLALDKNSKNAVDSYKRENGVNHILINEKPFMSPAEAIEIAMNEKAADTKVLCTKIVKRIFDSGMALAKNPNIESIVVDDGSIFFDYILFSHFGRRNQIESYQRGAPNNDFIEFLTALSTKNLCMVCRGTEIWKDSGEVDKEGRKKQAPSGVLKPEGFGKIGKFMTAVIELTARRKKPSSEDRQEALQEKYHVKVVTCKGDTLLEGQDLSPFGVSGEKITWDNLMMVLKAGD